MLFKFGYPESPEFRHVVEIAEHVFFVCHHFAGAKGYIIVVSGKDITPGNRIRKMGRDSENLWAVSIVASQIVTKRYKTG